MIVGQQLTQIKADFFLKKLLLCESAQVTKKHKPHSPSPNKMWLQLLNQGILRQKGTVSHANNDLATQHGTLERERGKALEVWLSYQQQLHSLKSNINIKP